MLRDALVVGLNLYPSLPNLKAPARDAEAIADRLQTFGDFRVRRLPEMIETDATTGQRLPRIGPQQQITVGQLEAALVQLFKPRGRHFPHTALFYYSGHGLQKDQGIQEGYLATSDADPAQGRYGLSLFWLRRLLQESPVRQQIVLLDCCHSGELLNFLEADPGARSGIDRLFMAASRDYETAFEALNSPYSVFTQALLDGLDPQCSETGMVSQYTLTHRVSCALKDELQQPLMETSGSEIMITRCQLRAVPQTYSDQSVLLSPAASQPPKDDRSSIMPPSPDSPPVLSQEHHKGQAVEKSIPDPGTLASVVYPLPPVAEGPPHPWSEPSLSPCSYPSPPLAAMAKVSAPVVPAMARAGQRLGGSPRQNTRRSAAVWRKWLMLGGPMLLLLALGISFGQYTYVSRRSAAQRLQRTPPEPSSRPVSQTWIVSASTQGLCEIEFDRTGVIAIHHRGQIEYWPLQIPSGPIGQAITAPFPAVQGEAPNSPQPSMNPSAVAISPRQPLPTPLSHLGLNLRENLGQFKQWLQNRLHLKKPLFPLATLDHPPSLPPDVVKQGNFLSQHALFSLEDQALLAPLLAHGIQPTCVLSPQKRWLAVAFVPGQVRLYALPSLRDRGQLLPVVYQWSLTARSDKAAAPSATVLTFSPNGEVLLAIASNGTTHQWQVGGSYAALPVPWGNQTIRNAQFSADGRWLATLGEDWAVRLWHRDSGQLQRVFSPANLAQTFSFSPSRPELAIATQQGEVQIWPIGSETPLRKMVASTQPITALAFSPDGEVLVVGDRQGHLTAWSVSTGNKLDQWSEFTDSSPDIVKIRVSSLGYVAALDRQGHVQLRQYPVLE